MPRSQVGTKPHMEDNRTRPTTNQPLNAEPRPRGPAILAVIGLLALIALVFFALTWVSYRS
jgi:hypothetical protein